MVSAPAHSSIFEIMREEHARLIQAEQAYIEAIAQLPRGALSIKHIRNNDYLYLAYRQGRRVVFDYVGPLRLAKARDTLERVEKRQRLVAQLKEVRRALKDVKKVLRGKI